MQNDRNEHIVADAKILKPPCLKFSTKSHKTDFGMRERQKNSVLIVIFLTSLLLACFSASLVTNLFECGSYHLATM